MFPGLRYWSLCAVVPLTGRTARGGAAGRSVTFHAESKELQDASLMSDLWTCLKATDQAVPSSGAVGGTGKEYSSPCPMM